MAQTCQQDKTQPDAQRLSQDFGVSYEEIMIWYCNGYSFDEIELAYSLSEMSGQPVYVIFNLHKNMSWTEINTYLSQFQASTQTSSNCEATIYMPKAQQLASKYGLTMEEVIDLTPTQILEMKSEGLNWGQLKKSLRDKTTGKPDKQDNPNKPDKPDNPNKPDKEDNPNKPQKDAGSG